MTVLDDACTEGEWADTFLGAARINGWTCAHFRPARTEHGWRTAVQADGAGFPDWVLVRERVIFVELKRQKGKLRPAQEAWIASLRRAGGEVYVWRPSDWPEVVATLARQPEGDPT